MRKAEDGNRQFTPVEFTYVCPSMGIQHVQFATHNRAVNRTVLVSSPKSAFEKPQVERNTPRLHGSFLMVYPNANNYRPTSLIPVAFKHLERLVRYKIMVCIITNSMISNGHHGFTKKRPYLFLDKSFSSTTQENRGGNLLLRLI